MSSPKQQPINEHSQRDQFRSPISWSVFKAGMTVLSVKQAGIFWGQLWGKKTCSFGKRERQLAQFFPRLVNVMSGALIALLAPLGHKQNDKNQPIKVVKQEDRKNPSPRGHATLSRTNSSSNHFLIFRKQTASLLDRQSAF